MYGFGLLGYRDTSFYDMDARDFIQMVEGALFWEWECEDRLFSQFAVFTAQQIYASGNVKKGTGIKKLVNGLYKPYSERLEESGNSRVTYVGRAKVEELRRRIREKFK